MSRWLVLACVLMSTPMLSAQTSFPMITHVTPVAVQRGKTTEVQVTGQMNFWGSFQTLVQGSGVRLSGLKLPEKVTPEILAKPPVVNTVKLQAEIDADTRLGVREFRIASALGLSSVGQMLVTPYPVVVESAKNNTPQLAQPVTLPATLTGIIEIVEDVDCFRFAAKKGETLTFTVYCARLQDKIHDLQTHADPLISVLDADGRELAMSDDARFADPLLTFTIPADGNYILQIRDAVYAGDKRWVYAIEATNQPVIQQVYPLAMAPGQSIELAPVGSAKLTSPKIAVTAPKTLGVQSLEIPISAGVTSAATVVVTPLAISQEVEPNNTLEQATPIVVPGGVNGRIGEKRDLDYFKFTAKKGQPLRAQVVARRFGTVLNSDLDSVLELMDAKGKILVRADDTIGKDAGLLFTPPADGDYFIRVRDLNSKGGEGFVYWLELTPPAPNFSLKLDPAHSSLRPGGRTALYVTATREDGMTGPISVSVRNLPPGVTASALTIPASMTYGVIVLTAASDATLVATPIEVVGSAEIPGPEGKPITVTRTAGIWEEIYLPGGGRGKFEVELAAVGITSSSDILEVQLTPKQPLTGETLVVKPGSEVEFSVNVVRRSDFNKPISLDILLRHLGGIFANPLPPGVTIVEGRSKTLLGTGSAGTITLKIAPDAAPVEDVPFCVCAYVSINFVVKIGYASPVVRLSIRK
ncbi:PPC domain-containing protein [Tuwongella immobilis]|uniref:Peptidase C-terminal archaeal/bacterial domain-containing protein n=1 Tax=Tuwongella immobilis TaxID=692036 RepID=A0A6C2YU51_9BACT|nr:PPC domain-containing protein [Tuwongella immobilis]VIP04954.1 Putative pre-peptidase OS=Singulisphaera acidiphila (strain ATCC BAA-1392 / DSM 18658 / VKM B-2454 / MOB10) GN=Sinac_5384 PE=4 SV=1 [Tuwongella immobilis]VTS07266.1 Putative pre-peptidase OS=Singulisphaera acidiphila (strain ATCC BAA-1392 / DSM 18658 / VKM B-2454 / MOB10) GN=Sinac_5384 PE=4 SV=1 [Tuwongella immobilis]